MYRDLFKQCSFSKITCTLSGVLSAVQRAEDTPTYDIWQRPDTPETCTSLDDSLSLNSHLALDFSETDDSDSGKTVTSSYNCSDQYRTPRASYLSDRMTPSSYLPHLKDTYTQDLFPFARREPQRDSFYDSRPTTRSLSNETLKTHRSGPYGNSHRNSPEPVGSSTTTPVQHESAIHHRPGSMNSPTLKWSLTPDSLITIDSSQHNKLSPVKNTAAKIPPIEEPSSSASQSEAVSSSQSQLHLQSLLNCQSQARNTQSKSHSYTDQSRHDFYY